MRHFDVVVLGAGAAGLFCAGTAAARGRRVLVLDHAEAAGKKILISGGGRCNFTNRQVRAENFISENPHFAKSALAQYPAGQFIALVEAAGIAFHEKRLGQLFCDGSAHEILALLMERLGGAPVDLSCPVTSIEKDGGFRLTTARGVITADALVVATGGVSIPKMGATGFAYEIARQFGVRVVTPRPALVPLTLAGEAWAWMQGLAGVSFETVAQTGAKKFTEAALFTHRGLSGPAVLQISSYWQAGAPVLLDLLPGQDAAAVLLDYKKSRAKAELKTILAELLPARLAHGLLQPPFTNQVIGTMPDKALRHVAGRIKRFEVIPSGTEGFAKAEVTAGGVDTVALFSQTMQARDVPGLYFIGEAVDVTGWLGGYNFQWAWSSGYAAGMVA
jgi:predicted Rossmann fold flavoprotein